MTGMMWNNNTAVNANWSKVQLTNMTATLDQLRDVEASVNADIPQAGEMRYQSNYAKTLFRAGGLAHSPWVDGSGIITVIPGIIIGGGAKGTWVLSAAGGSVSEYYFLPTGGGGLTDVAQLLEDDIFPFSLGTVGTLAAGQYAIADNDTLGFTTLYVRMMNTGQAVPSLNTASRLRYRTAAQAAITPMPRRLFGTIAAAPTAAYYLRGDTYLCIAPAAVTAGSNLQLFNNATSRGGTWVPMAEVVA